MSDIERLKVILERYGARSARWPDAERKALLALVTQDPDARRLAEASAELDRLLAGSPAPEPADLARLEDRIMAAALQQGSGATITHSSVATDRKLARTRPAGRSWSQRTLLWPSSAALAASLACGLYLGMTDSTSSVIDSMAALVGIADVSETEIAFGALDSDTTILEDLL